MKIGDIVAIAENDNPLDCCQGKRGTIAHVGTGGHWLLCTDHFCPRERTDDELTLIPQIVLAQEALVKVPTRVRASYEECDSDRLRKAAKRGDVTAWAILVLRGEE